MEKWVYGLLGVVVGGAAVGGIWAAKKEAPSAAGADSRTAGATDAAASAKTPAGVHFERVGDIQGLAVVLSPNGCQASVLLSDAQFTGADGANAYSKELSLKLSGGSADIKVDLRGFAADSSGFRVRTSFGGVSTSFSPSNAEHQNWVRSANLSEVQAGAEAKLEVSSGGDIDKAALFAVDSVDLVISGCANHK